MAFVPVAAAAGAISPGMGALLGGAAGGGIAGLANIFGGNKQKAPRIWDILSGPQQNLLSQLGPNLQGQLAGGPDQWRYGGQLNAPIGQGESDLVANNARMNAIAGNTFGQIGQYNPEDINAQFDKNVQNPTLSNWQNVIAPYIRAQAPAFSTDQARLVGESGQQLAANLGQQRMGYLQQGQTNALNALSGANSYYQGAAGIQAIPREIQQAGLDKAYADFLQGNQSYQNSVSQMLQFLGIGTTAVTPQSNPYQQAIAGAGAGANLGVSLAGANAQNAQNNAITNYINSLSSNNNANNNASQYSLAAPSPGVGFSNTSFNGYEDPSVLNRGY